MNGKANYKSGYYNLYNYEFFFTMVNDAIRTTFFKLIDVIKSYFGGTLPTAFSNLTTNENYGETVSILVVVVYGNRMQGTMKID